MPVKLLLFGLVLLAASPAGAAEPSGTIHWMVNGLPPKVIPDGPLKGQGYGEQQFEWLATHLPHYEHRFETVTPARLWYEMRTGQGICSIDIADLPEREQWAAFSRHRTSLPGYRMVVRKDRVAEFAEFLDASGAVDLDRLGASSRLFGIYAAGRWYMPEVNAFIDSPARKIRMESMSASTRVFEVISSRRADFSFAALTEANYFNYLSETPGGGKARPSVAMLPIKGGDEQVHGHIACSRDTLGLQVVVEVDRLLDDEALRAEFLAPENRWLEQAR